MPLFSLRFHSNYSLRSVTTGRLVFPTDWIIIFHFSGFTFEVMIFLHWCYEFSQKVFGFWFFSIFFVFFLYWKHRVWPHPLAEFIGKEFWLNLPLYLLLFEKFWSIAGPSGFLWNKIGIYLLFIAIDFHYFAFECLKYVDNFFCISTTYSEYWMV